MSSGFTQKEMLVRILNKLDDMDVKINSTHELASKTNGKVKLHTKALYSIVAFLITSLGWSLNFILQK